MELNIPQKYKNDVEKAPSLLKSEGCEAVYLFGSLVTGNIRDDSDIDIGIIHVTYYSVLLPSNFN